MSRFKRIFRTEAPVVLTRVERLDAGAVPPVAAPIHYAALPDVAECHALDRKALQQAAALDLDAAQQQRLLRATALREAQKKLAPLQAAGSRVSRQAIGRSTFAVGLPAIPVGPMAGVSTSRSTALLTTETLSVGQAHAVSAAAHAGAVLGLAGASVGLDATATATHQRTRIRVADSVDHMASVIAAEKTAGSRLDRLLAWAGISRANRHDEAISRARYWTTHPAIDTVTLPPGSLEAFSGPPAPPPSPLVDATLVETSLGAGAKVSVPVMGAMATATPTISLEWKWDNTRMVDPIWLPSLTLQEKDRAPLALAADERMKQFLASAPDAVAGQNTDPDCSKPAMAQVAVLLGRSERPADGLHKATEQLDAEFSHFQALLRGRFRGIDPAHHRRVIGRVCRQWHCKAPQDVLLRMGEMSQWLWLSHPVPSSGAEASPEKQAAAALLDRILASDVLDTRKGGHRALYASQESHEKLYQRKLALGGGLDADLASIGASLSLVQGTLQKDDPLRDGRFLELAIHVGGGADVGQLASRLARLGPGDIPGLQQALELPTGLIEAGATTTLRYFQPFYQQDSNFPDDARGLHLQHVRVQHVRGTRLGLQVPVAAAPGLNVELGLEVGRTHVSAARPDVFGSRSLVGCLLRYQSLRGQSPDSAWQCMQTSHLGSLLALAGALCDPKGPARAEAQFWLERGGHSPTALQCFTADRRLPAGPGAGNDPRTIAVLADLKALMDPIADAVRRAQALSPLCGAVTLDGHATTARDGGMQR